MTDEKPKNDAPATDGNEKNWVEDIEVASRDAVGRVKDLIEEGNVRRLIILNEDDRVLVEFPLTVGVAAGAGALMFAPILATVGAIVGVMAKIKLRVVRVEE